MGNIGSISWKLTKESVQYSLVVAACLFLATFIGELNAEDFFANLNGEILLPAVKSGVNAVWGQMIGVVSPFLWNVIHPNKK